MNKYKRLCRVNRVAKKTYFFIEFKMQGNNEILYVIDN